MNPPEGYHTVTPWIISPDSDALVSFIEAVFGGKEKEGSRFLDADGAIGHVEVQVGDSVVMLFDSKPGWPATPSFLRLYVNDPEAVFQRAQQQGATVVTELTLLFFGERVGRLRDPWGNYWWVHQRIEEPDPATFVGKMNDPAAIAAMTYVQQSLLEALANEPKR
jgi:uncharacterized glyoxalase superfamily protein PhnB